MELSNSYKGIDNVTIHAIEHDIVLTQDIIFDYLKSGCREHLKVTIFRAANIIGSPAGMFQTIRSFFSFTRNLPNPLIKTSSPDSRALLIISSRISIISKDRLFVYPICSATASTMSAFFRVMINAPLVVNIGQPVVFSTNIKIISNICKKIKWLQNPAWSKVYNALNKLRIVINKVSMLLIFALPYAIVYSYF
jgi:hypothetical protein